MADKFFTGAILAMFNVFAVARMIIVSCLRYSYTSSCNFILGMHCVHFDRSRSDNELNMHCHLIVSRKDQANKKKLCPLTNHKNTKKGAIKGGFDRTNLFRQAEQGFDKIFGYNRPITESFEYYNTMKNGSISDQLKIQERQISDERKNTDMRKGVYTDKQAKMTENKQSCKSSNLGLSSVLDILSPEPSNVPDEQIPVKRKKKKLKRGFRK